MGELTRSRIVAAVAALSIAVGGTAWAGCGSDSSEEVDEQIDQAEEQANEAAEKAQQQVEKAQEQLKKAQEKIDQNVP